MAKPAVVRTINPPSAKAAKPFHHLRLVEDGEEAKRDLPFTQIERKEADLQAEEDDLWDNVPI